MTVSRIYKVLWDPLRYSRHSSVCFKNINIGGVILSLHEYCKITTEEDNIQEKEDEGIIQLVIGSESSFYVSVVFNLS